MVINEQAVHLNDIGYFVRFVYKLFGNFDLRLKNLRQNLRAIP